MNTIRSRSRARRSAAITLLLLTLAALCENTTAWADSELRETLGNMIYPSEWTRSGQAPLVGGVYKEPAASGSASNIVIRLTDSLAVGRIGDQTMAALVIVTDPGGSGIFFDLYLVRQQENRWSIVDRAHLGDRIRVNRIEVERGLVGLDLTVHGPRDGACCPTERSTMYYALQSEQLVKVSTPAQNTPSLIEGAVWAWQYTQRVDGTRTTPTESGHYTLRLGPDGQLDVRADCNRAGGHYQLDGARLTLSVTHSTMAACPPESLDKQFLADVAAVTTWGVEDGRLRLNLMGGGTMAFTTASQ
ncbi:MAG TPA: META domain-containing protein [Nitrospiraceae bacterium]|nr:META domain-containing protein [Nitrospiraceae bacterium]